jgi:hypothetical protein
VASGRLAVRARAVRSLVGAIETPGDLLLVGGVALWSLALPLLKRVLPLPTLARLMWRRPVATRRRDREARLALMSRLVPRLTSLARRDNCLERSLLAYRLLSAAGARPRLVVAVGGGSTGVRGHVWVTVDGRPVHDTERDLEGFAPTIVFGDGGRAEHGRVTSPRDERAPRSRSDGVA